MEQFRSILKAKGLRKSFGGVHAVDGIDLSLGVGELRCIVGPNGAGKSTFFKVLIGQIKPDAGRVLFRGKDITRTHPFQRARLGVGIKFQDINVYENLTVQHNLFIPLSHHLSKSAIDRKIDQALDRLNLGGTKYLLVKELSHGQKQWLAIGMVLVMKPVLLLLDEPTAGMSLDETRATGDIIKSMNEDGVSIMVIEHDMAFVRRLNAPMTVLHYGKVFAEGHLKEIEEHEEVRRIYLGTASETT